MATRRQPRASQRRTRRRARCTGVSVQCTSGGRTPYDVLGVDEGAPPEVIKQTFRRRAKESHPDVVGADDSGAETRFIAIRAAFEELADPARRAALDARLAAERKRDADPGAAFDAPLFSRREGWEAKARRRAEVERELRRRSAQARAEEERPAALFSHTPWRDAEGPAEKAVRRAEEQREEERRRRQAGGPEPYFTDQDEEDY